MPESMLPFYFNVSCCWFPAEDRLSTGYETQEHSIEREPVLHDTVLKSALTDKLVLHVPRQIL